MKISIHEMVDDLVDKQDWDNEVLVGYLLEFVQKKELTGELHEHLCRVADEENQEEDLDLSEEEDESSYDEEEDPYEMDYGD